MKGLLGTGIVQIICGYGTWGQGFVVGMVVMLVWGLDFAVLDIFSFVKDSMNLFD